MQIADIGYTILYLETSTRTTGTNFSFEFKNMGMNHLSTSFSNNYFYIITGLLNELGESQNEITVTDNVQFFFASPPLL